LNFHPNPHCNPNFISNLDPKDEMGWSSKKVEAEKQVSTTGSTAIMILRKKKEAARSRQKAGGEGSRWRETVGMIKVEGPEFDLLRMQIRILGNVRSQVAVVPFCNGYRRLLQEGLTILQPISDKKKFTPPPEEPPQHTLQLTFSSSLRSLYHCATNTASMGWVQVSI